MIHRLTSFPLGSNSIVAPRNPYYILRAKIISLLEIARSQLGPELLRILLRLCYIIALSVHLERLGEKHVAASVGGYLILYSVTGADGSNAGRLGDVKRLA